MYAPKWPTGRRGRRVLYETAWSRHCERSEAISDGGEHIRSGLLRRFAPRNDKTRFFLASFRLSLFGRRPGVLRASLLSLLLPGLPQPGDEGRHHLLVPRGERGR